MGFWGAALYSGDFALDLRAAAAAVARLPLDDDALLAALKASEPQAAENPDDPDHTIFWLVAADQFARRGVFPEEALRRARAIIADGGDLARLQALGAGPADLRKRAAKLEEIRAALDAREPKARRTLAAPQPFVMRPGEVFVYPTSRGRPINPYFKSKTLVPNWSQDGWGTAVVVSAERAFDYLAWYRVMTLDGAREAPPELAALWGEPRWVVRAPGTCSPLHMRRMELARIGEVALDAAALEPLYAKLPSGRSAAVSDISLANNLSVGPRPQVAPETNTRRVWVEGLGSVARPLAG